MVACLKVGSAEWAVIPKPVSCGGMATKFLDKKEEDELPETLLTRLRSGCAVESCRRLGRPERSLAFAAVSRQKKSCSSIEGSTYGCSCSLLQPFCTAHKVLRRRHVQPGLIRSLHQYLQG